MIAVGEEVHASVANTARQLEGTVTYEKLEQQVQQLQDQLWEIRNAQSERMSGGRRQLKSVDNDVELNALIDELLHD